MRRQATVLSTCIVLGACGDNLVAVPDAPASSEFVPAPHAPMPSVLRHDGTVLANLRLVTLAFDGYDTAAVDRFSDAIVTSNWYTMVGAEYGIRQGSHSPTVTLGAAPAQLTRAAIEQLLEQRIASDSRLPKPVVDEHQLLYMIYIPASVARGPDLTGIPGYHYASLIGSARFPYAARSASRTPSCSTTAGARPRSPRSPRGS
jgi:hypothetical protein